MSLSMYKASVPVFIHMLNSLSALLDKGAACAEARKFDPTILAGARLAPDMFPLSRQVQIASDAAKGCAARMAGVEIPSFPDTETTIPELKERIAKTVSFLKGLNAAQIDGCEDKTVTIKLRGKDEQVKCQPYLLNFALPNLYFHVTTSYALLRHNGVDVGKADFLGDLQAEELRAAA